jgi:hypothetical protein
MILPLYFIHARAVCAGRNGEITTHISQEMMFMLKLILPAFSTEQIAANIHNFPKSCDVTCHTVDQL